MTPTEISAPLAAALAEFLQSSLRQHGVKCSGDARVQWEAAFFRIITPTIEQVQADGIAAGYKQGQRDLAATAK